MTDDRKPSNKAFGLFFTAMFAAVSIYSILGNHGGLLFWSLLASTIFLILSIWAPRLLGPPNKIWMWLGTSISKISTPIIMGTLFFLIISPISLLTRLYGRDELNLRKTGVRSAWISKASVKTEKGSFKQQF